MLFLAPYHYFSFFPTAMNGPLWSIGMEVSCYLLLPLFLWVIWRFGEHRWTWAIGGVIASIAVLQVTHLVIVKAFMTDDFMKGWQYGIVGGAKQWLPYWNPATFMGQFMCGSLASLVIVCWQSFWSPVEQGDSLHRGYLSFDVLALAGFILAGAFAVDAVANPGSGLVTSQPYGAPLFSLCCGMMLVGLHFSKYSHKVVDNPLFRHIATVSYGIYLWHFLMIELIHLLWVPEFSVGGVLDIYSWLKLSVLVTLLSWAAATFSYHHLEQPILRKVKNLTELRHPSHK